MFLSHLTAAQVPLLLAASVSVFHREGGWVTPLHERMVPLLFRDLLGCDRDPDTMAAVTPAEAHTLLPEVSQRREFLDFLLFLEISLSPVPDDIQAAVQAWADGLEVHGQTLAFARELAQHRHQAACERFYRRSWVGRRLQNEPNFIEHCRRHGLRAYAFTVELDPQLEERWSALQHCAHGSLGKAVWQRFQSCGFSLPGQAGAINEMIAWHDWVHVITGYPTEPLGEILNAGFIAAASSCEGATLAFLGLVSVFETGELVSLVSHGQPLGALSRDPRGPSQLTQALAHGRRCPVDPLAVDYFAIAERPLQDVRREWRLVP